MEIEVQVNAEQFVRTWYDIQHTLGASVLSKALRNALRSVCRRMRDEIPQWAGSRRLARAARPTVSYSVRTRRVTLGGRSARIIDTAKVGFGVGRQRKPAQRDRPGVGVSKSNIHWFVLGTQDRYTKKGYYRGKVQPYFQGMLGQAIQDLRSDLVAGFAKAWQQELARRFVSISTR